MKDLKNVKVDENEITRMVAIIDSMTAKERANHMIINGARRRRIAKGSGTRVQEVNTLLKQYAQARKMMKSFTGGGFLGKRLGKLKCPWVSVEALIRQHRSRGKSDADDSFGAIRRKKKPTYRVVVIDKERARDSRSVEVVGIIIPCGKPKAVNLKHDRIAHWMKNGAHPSDTVARLMRANPAPAAT